MFSCWVVRIFFYDVVVVGVGDGSFGVGGFSFRGRWVEVGSSLCLV